MPIEEIDGTLIHEKEALLLKEKDALLSEVKQARLLSKELDKVPGAELAKAITIFFNTAGYSSTTNLTPTPNSTPCG